MPEFAPDVAPDVAPEVVIVRAASIETVGPRGAVESLAIIDGRVDSVGDASALRKEYPGAELVDFRDQHLVPGLIEPHTHPDLGAQFGAWVDISGFGGRTVQDVENVLRHAQLNTALGEWIFAFGLDPMLSGPIGTWDRDRLDRLVPNHPIAVLLQSTHTLFVNSLAIAAAGLSDFEPNPGGGGEYGRSPDGRLNGIVKEASAMTPFMRQLEWKGDRVRVGIAEQYERYAQVGITSLGIAGLYGSAANEAMLREVALASSIRTTAYVRMPRVSSLRYDERFGDRFRLGGVKLWYDGSPYTGTMLLDEPYLDSDLCCCTLGIEAGSVGHANFSADEMKSALIDLAENGWQVLTHAQGDRGCREILDLYADVLVETGVKDHRWRLEHCALISDSDLERSATLGVSPSFHVNHVLHYGPELRDHIIGPERAERLMPLASALSRGHRISLHADTPMYPPSPLSLMRTAVTRLTRNGDVIGAHSAIDALAALRAVTIDAAWQLGTDGDVGSLEVGKRADFTVLEANPLRVDAKSIGSIEVQQTWLDGRPAGC